MMFPTKQIIMLVILIFIFSGAIVLPTLISGKTFYGIDGNVGVIKNLSEAMWKLQNEFWNNNYLLGLPIGVSFNISIFLGKIIGYDKVPLFDVFLYIVISFVGMYIFLRSSGLTIWGALFGGASISLTTMGILSVLGGHILGSLGFLIFALGLIKYLYSREFSFLKLSILVFIIGVSLGIAFADVQRTIYFGLILAAYVIFLTVTKFGKLSNIFSDGKKFLKFLVVPILIFTVFFVFSLSSISGLIGFTKFEQVGVSDPESKWRFLVQFSYPPEEILNFFVPGIFGYFSNDPNLPYWGRSAQDFDYEKTKKGMKNFRLGIDAYLNVFVLPFLLLSFIYFGKWDRFKKLHFMFWGIVGLIAFLFSIARYFPTFFWLLIQIPFFDKLRVPAKWMDIFSISLVIMSSFSFDSFLRSLGARSLENRRFLIFLSIYSLVLLFAYFVLSGIKPEIAMYFSYNQQYDYSISMKIAENISNSVGNAFVFVSIGTILLWVLEAISNGGFKPAEGNNAKSLVFDGVFLVFILVVFLNMFLVVKPLFRNVDAKKLYSDNNIVNFMKDRLNNEQSRVVMYSGLANHYYTFLFPYHDLETIQTIAQSRLPEEYTRLLPIISSFNFDLMAKFSTRYFLTELSPDNPVFLQIPILSYYTNLSSIIYLSEDQQSFNHTLFVYFISNSLPRFFITPNYIKYNGQIEMVLGLPIEVLKNSVLITNDIPNFSPSQTLNYSILVERYYKDYAKLRVSMSDKGFLVFNNYYHPKWKCFVDGKEKEILKANYLVQAIYIDQAGEHIVEFRFDSFSVFSLIQIVMLIVFFVSIGVIGFVRDI
ncbi:MAG: hypothetical protein ACK4F9_02845 [Brevinematia bacterium]